MNSTITIHRPKRLNGAAWGLKVYIDGKFLGKIKNRGTKTFLIKQGKHTIISKLPGLKSSPLTFNINEGEELALIHKFEEGKGLSKASSLAFVKDENLDFEISNEVSKSSLTREISGKIECPKCKKKSHGKKCTYCGFIFTNEEFSNHYFGLFIKGILMLVGSIILIIILASTGETEGAIGFLGLIAIVCILWSPFYIIRGLYKYIRYKSKITEDVIEEDKKNEDSSKNKTAADFLCKSCKHFDNNNKACMLYRFYVESDFKKYEKLCNGKYYAAVTG